MPAEPGTRLANDLLVAGDRRLWCEGGDPRRPRRLIRAQSDAGSRFSASRVAPPQTVRTDAERFDVYRVALEFLSLTGQLLPRRGFADLRDQLERASSSIVLNTGEGLGRFSAADKARFFVIARGSALECAAIVDILRVRRLATAALCDRARLLLVRLTQMLSKLGIRHRT